jgi:hypothetical protein
MDNVQNCDSMNHNSFVADITVAVSASIQEV